MHSGMTRGCIMKQFKKVGRTLLNCNHFAQNGFANILKSV